MKPCNRRRFCSAGLRAGAALATSMVAAGCRPTPAEPLRIGAQVFPGYEFLYLARATGQLKSERVRMVETPSASASLRALGTGAIDGACLTLDEVLSARERGIELTVLAVLDVSMGADVVLAHANVGGLSGLRGRTLGVEQSAVGAVMLDALLQRAGLSLRDVTIRPVGFDAHEAEFKARRIDAVVSYEPVKSRLMQAGAQVVYSSADIPGRILDVLAVRPTLLDSRPQDLQHLLDAHFGALDGYRAEPARARPLLAARLHLGPNEVDQAYAELDLPDRERNRTWFAGEQTHLKKTAAALSQVMHSAGLLTRRSELPTSLFDGRFL